jgi:murein DD-endopeptidase MepM/ murein hydrolase activator NlpD
VAVVHEYKRLENCVVLKVKQFAKFTAGGLAWFFKSIFNTLTRRYTVVLVPHSEKKVYNLHISILSICFFFLVFVGLLGAFVWYGISYRNTQGVLAYTDSRLQDTQASLDQLRDELVVLMKKARGFESVMSDTLSSIGNDSRTRSRSLSVASGDLEAFLDLQETQEGILQETEDVRWLGNYLNSLENPMEEVRKVLDSQSAFLTEIPSIWPIKGGIGHISMYFGQNINDFTHQWYIHKGIDISTYRQGDPIVATADGQVVSVEYDQGGFGHNIIIRHKHGFYTRYGHMLSFRAKIGQRVQQGEVIGYIGNTGLSTGPHLHYEVHIGSDVVDPYKYLNTRANMARASR